MSLDHIALIDAARRYRVPELRDRAKLDIDRLLCDGREDEIALIEFREQESHMFLFVTMQSGIAVGVPCNL